MSVRKVITVLLEPSLQISLAVRQALTIHPHSSRVSVSARPVMLVNTVLVPVSLVFQVRQFVQHKMLTRITPLVFP